MFSEPAGTFLRRFERLLDERQRQWLSMSARGRWLIDFSIGATYRDCEEFGVADEAVLVARMRGWVRQPNGNWIHELELYNGP